MRLIHKYHAPGWQPRSLRAVWLSVLVAAVFVLTIVISVAWAVFNVLSAFIERG